MKTLKILIIVACALFSRGVFGQSNAYARFTAPDTVCVNTPIHITNTSINGTNFYWNFSVADLNTTPEGVNLGNTGYSLSMPVYSDIVSDNGKYYVFVINNYPGGLVRLDFGNSLLNNPAVVSLGDIGVIPASAEGIQITKVNNKWIAVIVGGDPASGNSSIIVKIDFGNNLENASPVGTNWGNIGDLSYPHDFYLFLDKGNYYGFTVNAKNNTVTKFDFGKDFNSAPIGLNLGNIGNLNYPTGIYALTENNKWYVFITNALSNSLTRLDFGNSLLNTPKPVNLGTLNNTLHKGWDIYIMKFCDQTIGFILNGDDNYNDIVRIDFNNDIESIPSATSLGNIGSLSFPHSLSTLFRAENDVYSIVTNAHNNTITRIKFSGSNNSSIPNSSLKNPPDIKYSEPGVYNINLLMDEGLPTQTSFCKPVVVVAPPPKRPLVDTGFCKGDSLIIRSNGTNNIWNTGSTSDNIVVKKAGTYWVEKSNYGCVSRDSFLVSMNPSPSVFLGNDTSICNNSTLQLDAGNAGDNFLWNDGSTSQTKFVNKEGNYSVKVINESGCAQSSSIKVSYSLSSIQKLKDISICYGDSAQLKAISSADNFSWIPSTGLNNTSILSPVAAPSVTTKYILFAKDNKGCTSKDSLFVNVLDKPAISALTDTTICAGSTIHLQPKIIHANAYKWTPSKGLNNVIIADPFATPVTNTTYTITAANDGCSVQKNVTLNVLSSPVISINNDTTICENAFVQLNAYGGTHYTWSPLNGLNEASIANPLASPKTSTLYHVTVTDNNHCSSKDSVMINVSPSPSFSLDPTNATICEGDTLRLTASGGDVYQWQSLESIIDTDRATAYVKPSSTGVYNVIITNRACKIQQQLSADITVNKKPIITVSKSNDIDCMVGEAKLTATGGVQYTWSPASSLSNPFSQNPVATPLSTTVYHVKVKGNNTCVSEDSVEVKVLFGSVTNGYLMPDAFTPNGDGLNDCFGVQQWGYITELDFSVYDRFGLMIFHTTNPSDCWNGSYKGIPQASGTFVYQIKAKTLCGSVYRKGTFVLIR